MAPARDLTDRWQVLAWLGASSVAALLSVYNFGLFQVGMYADDAIYLALARWLASGGSENLVYGASAAATAPFPLGYPLLLAPFVALAPGNLDVLKSLSLVATLINGALLFWGWRLLSRRSRGWGLAVSALYLLWPYTNAHSRMILSEAVFTTLFLLVVLLTEQLTRRPRSLVTPLLLGAVMLYAALTRSIGVILLAGAPAYLLWRLRREAVRLLALLSCGALALTLLLAVTPAGPAGALPQRYLTERNNLPYRLAVSVGVLPALPAVKEAESSPTPVPAVTPAPATMASSPSLPAGLFPALTGQDGPRHSPSTERGTAGSLMKTMAVQARDHLTTDLRLALLPAGNGPRGQAVAQRLRLPWLIEVQNVLMFFLVALGCTIWIRKDGASAWAWCSLAYIGAILWWGWEGYRFLYPVQPMLMFCFLLGCDAVLRFAGATLVGRRPANPARALAAIVLLLLSLFAIRSAVPPDRALSGYDLALRTAWLRDHTPPSAVVMSELPALDALYGERRAVQQPESHISAADLSAILTSRGVDYILIAPFVSWRDGYVIRFSGNTTELLRPLAELWQLGRLSLTFMDEVSRVAFYKVQ